MTEVAAELWMTAVTPGAKRQALDGVVGQAFKCFFQVGAGKTLQGDAEQLHSVEKHAHTAKQCNDVG